MMPTPPPMMHGDHEGEDSALERDRLHTTDRADQADPELFHDANAEAYGAASAADQHEADPGTADHDEPRGDDDSLPLADDPAVTGQAAPTGDRP